MRASPRPRPRANRRVSNVVFMGMGEPFANYDTHMGGASNASTTTSGSRPATSRCRPSASSRHPAPRHRALPVNLAVSLHAANDALRDELVPINRRYPSPTLVDGVPRVPRRHATAGCRSSGH